MDDLASTFAKLYFARIFEGESQIDEHVEHNVVTKGWVPVAQAAGAALGILAFLGGLALIVGQVAWLIDLDLTGGDYLLLTTLSLLVLFAAIAAVRYLISSYSGGLAILLGSGLGLMVILGIVASIYSKRAEFSLLRGAAVAGGLALLLPGLGLSYRQLTDLIDPFGKTSPTERMLFPYLPALFGEAEPKPEPPRLIPYRARGAAVQAISNAAEPEPELHPDDLDLIDFVANAEKYGIARKDLLQKPRIRLRPTGNALTRQVYDDMMERLDLEWGFIARGGNGVAAEWLVEPGEALAILRGERDRIRAMRERST